MEDSEPSKTLQVARHHPTRKNTMTKPSEDEARLAAHRLQLAKRDYGRGSSIQTKSIKDKKLRANMRDLESRYQEATLKAKDSEILHENTAGFLEAENELEKTYKVRQSDILSSVNVETAKKGFSLDLSPSLGPYRSAYSRNGRHLLLSGRKGHVATMDWRSGTLGCELQLKETVRDATWLHNSQYFALAQSRTVYIYDSAGVELHNLTDHTDISFLQFLPYHFLLASVGNAGHLKYHDTSTGKLVAHVPTRLGPTTSLTQNKYNAVLHTGHQNGVVSLWSPASQAPLAKILAHRGPVRDISVDREGRYMVTVGQDSKMCVWDIRKFAAIHSYSLFRPGASVDISDRGLTAVGWGTQVSIWRDLFVKHVDNQPKVQSPYMSFPGQGRTIEQTTWCPFEDILGISHDQGFTSALVPGAGEANFDAMEINPFENVKQRQESEVKALLNKLKPEMIALDPDFVGQVDTASHETRMKEKDLDRDEKKEEMEKLEKLKNRGRGKNSSLRKYLRKKGGRNVIDDKRVRVEEMRKEIIKKNKEKREGKKKNLGAALDRFVTSGKEIK